MATCSHTLTLLTPHQEQSPLSRHLSTEIVRQPADPSSFTLLLPVSPPDPVKLSFHHQTLLSQREPVHIAPCTIKHLPPLQLEASLPNDYPGNKAPYVRLSTSPRWIPDEKLIALEKEAGDIWQEYGGCQILFAYIDNLQQAVDRVFDLADKLVLPATLKPEIVEYDRKRDKEVFEAGSYDCGVCLDPKKGTLCHLMHSCGHVFCRACLQSYYSSAITEGDVINIVCLEPSCGKDIDKDKNDRRRKRTLHPRELLEIGIAQPQARRFVELKRKKKLESDKSTIYCPRSWCQAPARSAKHPPIPDDLTLYIDSDDDHDTDEQLPVYTKDTPEKQLPAPADRLTVCSKCSLAFCRVCYAGWHGEFARCWPRNPAELSEEEKASYDYIRLHTSPCPTCSSPTQKTMGCNHMACFQCNTHFCYLCGAWLEPSNPYQHFNNKASSCYQRLWELEGGDEGNGEVAFDGARRWEAEARAIAAAADEEERAAAQAAQPEAVPLADAEWVLARPHEHAPPPEPVEPMNELVLQMEELRADPPEQPEPNAQGGERAGGRRRNRRRGGNRARPAADAENDQVDIPPRHPQLGRRPPNAVVAGNARGPNRANHPALVRPHQQEQALLRFIAMAQRDQEDEWDSDELEDVEIEWE